MSHLEQGKGDRFPDVWPDHALLGKCGTERGQPGGVARWSQEGPQPVLPPDSHKDRQLCVEPLLSRDREPKGVHVLFLRIWGIIVAASCWLKRQSATFEGSDWDGSCPGAPSRRSALTAHGAL